MIRVSVWLIRRLGTNAIVAVALMLVALGSVALGLADSVHGLDLGLLLPVAVLGLLCGWALAKSPLPGWLGAVVALTLGVEVIFVRIGRLAEPLVALLRALVDSLIGLLVFLGWGFWQVHQSEWPDNLPDATPLLLAWQELWADSGIVLLRLWNWLAGLVMGESSFDLVAVALVWSLVFFLGATWAGWWARRHNRPLVGMAPAGALLSACLFFARSDPVFVLPLMGATLLLMALIGQDARERRWSATGVDFPSDVSSEVKLVGAGLSLMLVTTAALVPSITWRQVVDRAGRLVAGRPNNVQVVTGPVGPDVEPPSPATALDRDQVRTPGLPRLHLLGSGPELSKQVVMFVYVAGDQDTADGNISGPSELTPEESTPHYYWRSLTYDRYTGRGWTTGGTRTLEYQAGDLALYKDPLEPVEVGGRPAEVIPPGYRKVQAEVRAVSALGELLHTTGDLLTVDRGYRVAWRSHEDAFGATIILAEHVPSGMGTRPPAPDTPAQTNRVGSDSGIGTPNTRISTQVVENTPVVYRTTSLVSAVGEAQLRAAASDYPGWVEERYLALPDSVPPRVLALARDLTVTEPTPYDQARAIESYLRTFSYNLDLPSPHFERDVVDYFLFDLKQGYCDYYATSMVVLARAAGLPARLAVGYFTGSYDEVNHRYVVTEADAHAWVEIYFPGYGWIEFEPTAGIPPIHRPADLPPVLPPEPGALDVGQPEVSSLWWLGLVAAIGLLSLGSLGRSALDSWRLRRMPPEATLATLYRRFRRHGQRLAVPMQPGNTPYEYLTSFTEHVAGVAQRSAWAALLVPGAQEARWLIGLYVRTCYGPQSPDVADQRQAIRTWRHLHRRLWVVWVSHVWEAALQIISASIHSAHRVERLPGD